MMKLKKAVENKCLDCICNYCENNDCIRKTWCEVKRCYKEHVVMKCIGNRKPMSHIDYAKKYLKERRGK